MTATTLAPLDLDALRSLALALLLAERRQLRLLDDDVRRMLGMQARRGRLRLDDLQLRLVQLIDSDPVWRRRADRARSHVLKAAAMPVVPGVIVLGEVPAAPNRVRRRAA